jgi:hypothetical protein
VAALDIYQGINRQLRTLNRVKEADAFNDVCLFGRNVCMQALVVNEVEKTAFVSFEVVVQGEQAGVEASVTFEDRRSFLSRI